MKSAFTRTGKRDTAGLLDDGVKSLTRYFLNNFRDGAKQDIYKVVLLVFKSSIDRVLPKLATSLIHFLSLYLRLQHSKLQSK
jgi:hypothetical protein